MLKRESSRVGAYVTTDNNYVEYAVIALQSFRRFFPSLDAFIVTDEEGLSCENRGLLQKHSIGVLNGEWYRNFSTIRPKWPPIVYAMLEGPSLLYKAGYQYSIGLDADVICLRSFDLDAIVRQIHTFAGIANQESIFLNFTDRIRLHEFLKRVHGQDFEISSIESLVNPNTGVVFWNNAWADGYDLCAKAKFCYDNLKDLLIAVDQSLLAAVIATYGLRYTVLGHEYNYRLGNVWDQRLSLLKEQIRVVHFTGPKPWGRYPIASLALLRAYFRQRFFRKQWRLIRRELYGDKPIR